MGKKLAVFILHNILALTQFRSNFSAPYVMSAQFLSNVRAMQHLAVYVLYMTSWVVCPSCTSSECTWCDTSKCVDRASSAACPLSMWAKGQLRVCWTCRSCAGSVASGSTARLAIKAKKRCSTGLAVVSGFRCSDPSAAQQQACCHLNVLPPVKLVRDTCSI